MCEQKRNNKKPGKGKENSKRYFKAGFPRRNNSKATQVSSTLFAKTIKLQCKGRDYNKSARIRESGLVTPAWPLTQTEWDMVAKRSFAEDTSEDTLPLLPEKKLGNMLDGETQNVLKLSQRVAYGVGHVMNDICAAMWFSYTLLFFEVVLEMPSIIAGSVIFIGQFVDAVSSPIIGILVDRYGTRKSWHMIGTALIAFSFSLIFSKCPWRPEYIPILNGTEAGFNSSWDASPDTEHALSALYYSLLVTIFQVGWATVQIAHLAIIPEMTPDKNGRADLTAIRYTATVCSSVFVYLVTWFILHLTGGSTEVLGPKDSYKFKDVVLIGLLAGGTFTMLFHALLKTPNQSEKLSEKPPAKSAVAWFAVVIEYFKSWRLYQVTLVYFSSRMLLNISLVYMPLFLVENLGNEAEYIATVPLASYVASFLASLAVRQVRSFCDSKISYFIGAGVSIGAAVWIGIGLEQTGELFGVSVLLGAGSSITGVASLCLCADLIGTDTENGAFVYSVVTAVDKLLGGIAVVVIEKFKQDVNGSSHYYQDTLAYGCGVSSLLGLITLLTMCCYSERCKQKKLSEKPSESSMP